jgi:hypothetical protein
MLVIIYGHMFRLILSYLQANRPQHSAMYNAQLLGSHYVYKVFRKNKVRILYT